MQNLIDAALGKACDVPAGFMELVNNSTEQDRKRIVSLLVQYGWHGTDALEIMLEERRMQDKYRDYMGVVQRSILAILADQSGYELDLPGYIDFMYPDTASAEEIKQRILDKLRE